VGYNLKNTKSGFEPIPSDRYTIKVNEASVGPHVKNGTEAGERIELVCHITEGKFANRKVWDYIYLPAATWKARQILEACKSNLINNADVDAQVIATELIGAEYSAWIESTLTGDGKNRTNLSDYKATEDIDMPSILK
jgi:hypothetical protein